MSTRGYLAARSGLLRGDSSGSLYVGRGSNPYFSRTVDQTSTLPVGVGNPGLPSSLRSPLSYFLKASLEGTRRPSGTGISS